MEFAKRISELAHLVRRLSRVQADEARSRRLLASARSAPNLVEDEVGLRISAGQQRVRSPASVHHHALSGCAAAQNQLLLRRIPLSVSLVERSWWKLECRQRQREVQRIAAQASAGAAAGTTAGSASSPPASSATGSAPSVAPVMQPEKSKTLSIVQPSPAASRQHIDAVVLLLKLLHSVEEARRQLLWRKEGAARRRCTAADDKWQQFQEEFAPQLRRRNRKSGKQDDVHREDSVALLRETANMLQERCRAAKADASLLRASLLARSFVSARLWELLLRKSVWTAAVVEHKHAAAVDESSLAAPHATRLLLMCLAFTRLSMGVLRDYVEGRCFSRHAPRFVVSMPSRSWQSRKRNVDARSLDGDAARSAAAADTSVEAGDGARDSKDRSTADATPGSNQEDALFSILQGALQVPSSAAADIALAASAPLARDSASMKMRRDVQEIFMKLPKEKQVMMFSATMTDELRDVAKKFMKDATEIYVDQRAKLTLHGLAQFYMNVTEPEKTRRLAEILDVVEFNQAIIFTSSVERCEALNRQLQQMKFPSQAVHSRMSQEERLRVYESCKANNTRIMVATDLFGRGVDFDRINLVVQYDMASEADSYLHRVGRAGRFGTKGLTIAFITTDEKEIKRENRTYTDGGIMKEVQERFEMKVEELTDINTQLNENQYMNK